MLEVRQAEELVYNAGEVIPALEQAIQQTENLLSFLTGRNPSAIERGISLTDQQMPPAVPAGLPSDLIERRSDIRAAENSLVAANLRIAVAKKEYFPRISLLVTRVDNSQVCSAGVETFGAWGDKSRNRSSPAAA
jgi:multidrug efflux system outer membrane protein